MIIPLKISSMSMKIEKVDANSHGANITNIYTNHKHKKKEK